MSSGRGSMPEAQQPRLRALGARDPCARSCGYNERGEAALDGAQEVAAVAFAHTFDCAAVALLNGNAVLHYSPSSAAGGNDTPRARERCVVLRGHSDALTAVAWSIDDVVVVTASLDRTVRVWIERSAVCLHTLTRTGTSPGLELPDRRPGEVVVPRRCQSGTRFEIIAARGTARAEIAVPGSNPSVEVLPAGSRVFEVLAPAVPIISMEAPPVSMQPEPGMTVMEQDGCVVVGMLEQGEALVLPPLEHADEVDLRLRRHGRVKIPNSLCYEALRPRPKAWDKYLSLAEMDSGDHLQAPRPLLGQASVAAAPLLRDGTPVAVRAAHDAVLFADLTAASERELQQNINALESQIKPAGPGASSELHARIKAVRDFMYRVWSTHNPSIDCL
jgi:hypothetical protein